MVERAAPLTKGNFTRGLLAMHGNITTGALLYIAAPCTLPSARSSLDRAATRRSLSPVICATSLGTHPFEAAMRLVCGPAPPAPAPDRAGSVAPVPPVVPGAGGAAVFFPDAASNRCANRLLLRRFGVGPAPAARPPTADSRCATANCGAMDVGKEAGARCDTGRGEGETQKNHTQKKRRGEGCGLSSQPTMHAKARHARARSGGDPAGLAGTRPAHRGQLPSESTRPCMGGGSVSWPWTETVRMRRARSTQPAHLASSPSPC